MGLRKKKLQGPSQVLFTVLGIQVFCCVKINDQYFLGSGLTTQKMTALLWMSAGGRKLQGAVLR